MSNEKANGVRVDVMVDGDLWSKETHLAGNSEPAALVREVLMALIQRESAWRLARLHGNKITIPHDSPEQRLRTLMRELHCAIEDIRSSLASSLAETRQVLTELRREKRNRGRRQLERKISRYTLCANSCA